jgi:hypothetical protein
MRGYRRDSRSMIAGTRLVGNSHFDVIGLGRKHRDRLVLRFPAEPCDGAVIAAAVWTTADAQRRALRRRGVETVENFPILDGIDQAQSKHLQRDSEGQISGGQLAGKIGLRDGASPRARAMPSIEADANMQSS